MMGEGVRGAADVDAMATAGDGEAAVLLWHYHDVDQPASPLAAVVTVQGIPREVHRVLVTHYRIDGEHSNAYTVWKAMGSPQHPTAEQYAELKSKDGLQLLTSPDWMDVANGQVRLSTTMPRQSISLVHLKW
jgi:xylan 1,4-beta-xylosidase